MNLIIAGGGKFADYKLLKEKVSHYLSNTNISDVTIISGGAKGSDTLSRF